MKTKIKKLFKKPTYANVLKYLFYIFLILFISYLKIIIFNMPTDETYYDLLCFFLMGLVYTLYETAQDRHETLRNLLAEKKDKGNEQD